MYPRPSPVLILEPSTKRDSGDKARKANFVAAKTIADIVRTCLGPRALLKMIIDRIHGTTTTSDGNAILRELQVSHPAARSIIDLARTQDEQVGDGTTSVIILAGEILDVVEPYLELKVHPRTIVSGIFEALADAIKFLDATATKIDLKDDTQILKVMGSAIGTKISNKHREKICKMALKALKIVAEDVDGSSDINFTRFVNIQRIHGGEFTQSKVIDGIALEKDVTHSSMKRRIENPRVILLDCGLEYSKGESRTDLRIRDEKMFAKMLDIEEAHVRDLCSHIIKLKPDLVVVEKALSDFAQQILCDAGITALRRCRRSELDRMARATGATVLHRPEELREQHVGTECGLFEIRKVGDDYYTFLENCKNPKACTIWLRGASKDYLSEIWRNLNDAMAVGRDILTDPRILPGGGAFYMTVAHHLRMKSESISGVKSWPYKALSIALEVIPRTLVENSGGNAVRVITELRAKHSNEITKATKSPTDIKGCSWGVDGVEGKIVDMNDPNGPQVWDAFSVGAQIIKTAVESATVLIRIDEVVSVKIKPPPKKPAANNGMPGMGGGMMPPNMLMQ